MAASSPDGPSASGFDLHPGRTQADRDEALDDRRVLHDQHSLHLVAPAPTRGAGARRSPASPFPNRQEQPPS